MQFDARAAKLLQPGEHLVIADCPGLRLEVSATRRSWIYRYKSPVDGRMRQSKIGAWPAMSPAAAIVEWERLRAARDGGADPAAEKRAARTAAQGKTADSLPHAADYTVRRLCDDYLSGYIERRRKRKGADEVGRMFNKMLGGLGSVRADSITRAQAFDFLDGFASIPVQAAKLRAELGAAWDYALDAGRLSDTVPNWWRQVMRGRLRSKGKRIEGKSVGTAKRVLTPKEVGELVRWMPNFSRVVADALTLYLWTGCRGSEIVSMEVRELSEEPDGLWWTIPKMKTKNSHRDAATDLRVPLIGRAEQIVRRRRDIAVNGYLFPVRQTGDRATVGHIEQKTIQTAVHYHQPYSKTKPKSKRPRLTITHWAPHDLRRTLRTTLTAQGCPTDVAEAIIGHMQPGVQGVYNLHAYDHERHAWLKRISAYWEAQAAHGGEFLLAVAP
ncbi:tyrosine-type recombinase/integrase [Cupriavidus malaysiensis]|uniref:Alpha/beta hydrolase n=1 Tax=Cupriavidus malaysiensis TaxID=367825 RepID=A0ABM6F3M8_9BURK|nr:integrase family protein [Cupriavidus malaysiensis]AOZ05939.1 alpha/beta hydrolase [Cupriavidus malaysiensis]